ncbi:hypothetical protein BKA60DRAFT_572506 [Fusarium oxysporum]|nr:hypothetical protein BKA60DRAFT_572506 [Fusarium oxysporum]
MQEVKDSHARPHPMVSGSGLKNEGALHFLKGLGLRWQKERRYQVRCIEIWSKIVV